ncbi:uncharacterized protein BO95DRAFT_439713 [Aspergillus brunneoviolaceus CBS 621.78]|uniref:Uncharacterized protein n=1 Tax=Aspergillus brunneoviolaceus CBS 621.78 TaxID=1450534 RepID=A0ACD1GIL1_9EURO|nr:hypothetical protein BO95DRAFT_439713 [Aspergillus brunneoviolaceus CBS 621.78]RAH49012.1 hypothetical protein BO95DRAFT_439713 [Aspergillus brunneoviolaceus CBS 621.78]
MQRDSIVVAVGYLDPVSSSSCQTGRENQGTKLNCSSPAGTPTTKAEPAQHGRSASQMNHAQANLPPDDVPRIGPPLAAVKDAGEKRVGKVVVQVPRPDRPSA